MALGSNLVAKGRARAMNKIMRCLRAGRGHGRFLRKRSKLVVFVKAGVPANNTAADSPEGIGFIYDITNDDLYFCHTWASSTSFTVVKVSA